MTKNKPNTNRYAWFVYVLIPLIFTGSNIFSKKPVAVPRIPTIVKKQKFIILTAVPETIFLFVKCKTGTRIELKLAFAAKIQKTTTIKSVL